MYWNDEKNIAETYLDFKFLLRPNAENLKCELIASITGLDMTKFLQLSMDGLNTDWNVLNLVSNYLVEAGYKILIEIGCCSLHGWEIHKVLEAIHKIFNESRARHDVYLNEGSSNKFPIKFYETRLVENKEVLEHALEIWESVVATVRYWESLCK